MKLDSLNSALERLEDRVLLTVDLAVTNTGAPTIAAVGHNEVYTITIANNGTTPTTGATIVTDTLPANSTFVTASSTGGGVITGPVANVLTDTIPVGLGAGGTDTLSITVTPTAPGVLVNTATATDAADTSTSSASTTNTVTGTGTAAGTPDLAIVKHGTPATIGVGGTESYTLVVTSGTGTAPATVVVVSDLLPAGATGARISGGPAGTTFTTAGTVATATMATFPASSSTTFTVTATLNAPGVAVNTANVESANVDPTPADNVSTATALVTATATVTGAPDLAIVKTGTPATLGVGGTETYKLVVTSGTGTRAATGVVVDDVLPAGATLISETGGPAGTTFTTAGNVATAAIASLPASSTNTLTLTARLNTPGINVNTATVESAAIDPTPADNVSTATALVTATATVTSAPDLAIVKTGTPATLGMGGTETYTLVVTAGTGANAATNVVVNDVLPAGSTLISETGGPAGTTYTTAGNVATAMIPSLPPSSTNTLTLTATLNAPGVNVNTATVESAVIDPTPADNVSTATALVTATATVTGAPDLAIVKTGTPATIGTGGTETYTLVVTSGTGTRAATGVVVDDLLPAGATLVSETGGPAGTTFTTAGNVATATIASLPASSSTTLTITATLNAPGVAVNTATVESAAVDTTPADNVSTATALVTSTATVTGAPDLAIVKTGTPATLGVGGTETYKLVVTSGTGTRAATGVVVDDVLPAGATLVSETGGPASTTFTTAGNVATATIARLAANRSTTLTITATLNAPGVAVNTASVESAAVDPTPADNVSTATALVTSTATVTGAPDLAIVKTGAPATLGAGGTETYSLVVTSGTGTVAATGVIVDDVLPAGATLVSETGGPAGTTFTTAGNVATASIASFPASSSTTLTIAATLNAPGIAVNTASVESAAVDPTPADNVSTATALVTSTATVTGAPDLAIVKTGTPATLGVGGTETYSLVVTSGTGTRAATGVVVDDLLPAGATLVSETGGPAGTTFTTAGNVATATIASLPASSSTTLTITATLNAPGVAVNTASVESAAVDPTPADNVSTATALVTATATVTGAPDLAIVKTGTPATIAVGGTETYTLVVTSGTGTRAATGVVVDDVLPAGATLVSETGGPASTTFTTVGNVATATIARLPASRSTTLTITATLNAPGIAVNTATVESAAVDPTPADNVSTATTLVTSTATVTGAPDLAIVKTGTPATLGVGGTETYSLVVTSGTGTTAATGVIVDDLLPAGATFVSETGGPAGTTFTTAGNVATASIASFPASSSTTLTITATLNAPGIAVNTASVESAAVDPTPADNVSTATALVTGTATVTGAPDLAIVKTGTPATLGVGGTETYTLVVTAGTGTTAATNVVVDDVLPAGATLVSETGGPAGTTFTTAGNVATATIASLPASSTNTLTVTATLNAPGVNVNTATVESAAIDTTPADNVSTATALVTATATVTGAPDLAIVKTGTPATLGVGGTETYSLVVTAGNGTTAATNVVVDDVLPAGATLISETGGPAGTTFTTVGNVATATIASLPASSTNTLTVTAKLNTPGVNVNTATVESAAVDPTPADNVSTATALVTATATVTGAPDLAIVKTGTPGTLGVGGTETYTLVVTAGTGTTAATNVVVDDVLPAGATPVSETGGPAGTTFTTVGNVATATIASLPASSTNTLTLTAKLNNPGVNVNTATVESAAVDPTPADNVSTATALVTATATVTGAPDLAIVKTGTPATLGVGGTETYTLVVTAGTGTTAATNVVVDDILPAGATPISETGGPAGTTFTTVGNVVMATIASLPASSTNTLTLTATLKNPGVNVNTATVESAAVDPTPADNVSTATALVTATATVTGAPDLAIVKTGTPATLGAGGTETYTLVVTAGTGTTAATNVVVDDVLPTGATPISETGGPAGTSFTTVGNVVTASIASLPASSTNTLTLTAKLNTLGANVNTATVESAAVDPTPADNVSTFTTTVTSTSTATAVLSITKSGPTTDQVGTPITYIVTVTNTGGAAAAGATVTDTLPTGLTNIVATDSSGSVSVTGTTVTDTLGTVGASGGTETLTITATPGASLAGTSITNTATVTFNGTSTTSNAVTTSITAASAAALSITKSGPASDTVGTALTYTIVVANTGGSAATGATVTDILPVGLTGITATDATGTVTVTGNTVTDALGAVAAGGSETLTITATPAASLSGTSITNSATVTFNGTPTTSNIVTTVITAGSSTGHICFAAGVPGDGTIQTFITNLYRELLGREPDAPSLPFWVGYLQVHDNAVGRFQVTQAFMDSDEYKIHYVTCVYENFLDRAPDAGGLQFWVDKMGNPGTPGENTGSADEKYVVAAIMGSDEYYLRAGNTPQGWINALYEDVFNRPADGDGMQFWMQELATRGAGDRDGIVRDLLTTPEAASHLLNAFWPTAGGTASTPLAAPGTEAGTGLTKLSVMTGGGWENLYFEGAYQNMAEGSDGFFDYLEADGSWDDVQLYMLNTDQFYTNPNRPVTV